MLGFFIVLCLVNIFFFHYHLQTLKLYQVPTYKEAFYKLHHELDGPLTPEKAEKVNARFQKLFTLVSTGTYSTKYDKDTYTGYEFPDFELLKEYFQNPIKDLALYGDNMKTIVEQAKKNMHQLNRKSYTYSYNKYIESHYQNRSVGVFYNFVGWQYLFNYQFSDILIIFLLACFILPTYIKEKKSMMNEILDTTEKGKKSVFKIKIGFVVVASFALVFSFAIMNMIMANVFIGLRGFSAPIYSISDFAFTPYSCSIIMFYLLCLLCKIIGFSVIGSLFLLITKHVKEYLSAFMIMLAVVALLLYINGYIGTFSTTLRALSLLSPFHLLNFPSITQAIQGFGIFQYYINNDFIEIIVQFFLFIVIMIFIVKQKKGIHHVKMGIKKNPL